MLYAANKIQIFTVTKLPSTISRHHKDYSDTLKTQHKPITCNVKKISNSN